MCNLCVYQCSTYCRNAHPTAREFIFMEPVGYLSWHDGGNRARSELVSRRLSRSPAPVAVPWRIPFALRRSPGYSIPAPARDTGARNWPRLSASDVFCPKVCALEEAFHCVHARDSDSPSLVLKATPVIAFILPTHPSSFASRRSSHTFLPV